MTPSLLAVPCLGLLLLAVPRVAHAQPALALETLLGGALTAGTEALLVRHAKDTRVPMRWLGNLRHDDPLVRATAAHDAYALTRLANADDASLARGLVIVTALRPDSLATHLRTTWLTEVVSVHLLLK